MAINKLQVVEEGRSSYVKKLYETNHLKIEQFWETFEKENKRPPTKQEIARGTGLSRPCIDNHIESITMDTISHKHKIKLDKILTSLEHKAQEGDVAAIKLYFQIVGKWIEKTKETIETKESKTLKVEFIDNNKKIEAKNDSIIEAEYEITDSNNEETNSGDSESDV